MLFLHRLDLFLHLHRLDLFFHRLDLFLHRLDLFFHRLDLFLHRLDLFLLLVVSGVPTAVCRCVLRLPGPAGVSGPASVMWKGGGEGGGGEGGGGGGSHLLKLFPHLPALFPVQRERIVSVGRCSVMAHETGQPVPLAFGKDVFCLETVKETETMRQSSKAIVFVLQHHRERLENYTYMSRHRSSDISERWPSRQAHLGPGCLKVPDQIFDWPGTLCHKHPLIFGAQILSDFDPPLQPGELIKSQKDLGPSKHFISFVLVDL